MDEFLNSVMVTKKQKFENLLNGENPGTGNVLFSPILMHFAARFAGFTYGEFASDHKALVESNLRCLDYFDLDNVGLISDPYRETSAFGAPIEFVKEGVPRCLNTIVKSMDDVRALKNPDVYRADRTSDRIRAGEALFKATQGHVPIIGWIEGPLAEACDLAGVSEMFMQLMIDPDFTRLLLEKTTITAKAFAKAQVEAGCCIIGMGDAICSQISAEDYRKYVKSLHQEIVAFVHEIGGRLKLHICGDISHLMEDLKEVQPDILDLDYMVDMDRAFQVLGHSIIRCGNINPMVIQDSTADRVRALGCTLIERESHRRFILSGGCEITVRTPVENLSALGAARNSGEC
jgi:uroporphyrinogen decarboxylase